MASHMAKPETQKKIQEMKSDPEFKAMFDDIAKKCALAHAARGAPRAKKSLNP